MASTQSLQSVQLMYVSYFGRPADPLGLQYWAQVLDDNDGDLFAIANSFGAAPEYLNNFAPYVDPEGNLTDTAGAINLLYQQMFNRDADAAGLAFYTEQIETGAITLAQLATTIAVGATGDSVDAAILANKTEVAGFFTDQVAAENREFGPESIPGAQSLISDVNATEASVTAGFAASDTFISGLPLVDPQPVSDDFILVEMATQYSLLQGIETTSVADLTTVDPALIIANKIAPVLTPTMNNTGVLGGGYTSDADDMIIGDSYALFGAVINGGGGNNTLRIDMKGPFTQPSLIENVQTVQVTNLQNVYDADRLDFWDVLPGIAGSPDSIMDLSRALDIETLVINEGSANSGSLDVWNVQNGATSLLEGNFDNNVRVDYAGSLDNVDLVLSNVRFESTSVPPALEISHNAGQVNLTSDGRVNILQNVTLGDFLDTLVIDGDAPLYMNEPLVFRGEMPATVDTSAATGNVTMTIYLGDGSSIPPFIADPATQNREVVLNGGEGDDNITLDTTDLKVGQDNVPEILLMADMGAGSDTIQIENAAAPIDVFMANGSSVAGNDVTLAVAQNLNLILSHAEDLIPEGANVSIELDQGATVTLTPAQYETFGVDGFSLANRADAATISLVVDEGFDVDSIDFDALPEGITLGLSVPEGVTLELTAEQYLTLVQNGVQISGVGAADFGTVNITGLTQAIIDQFADDDIALNLTGNGGLGALFASNAAALAMSGSITFDGDVSFGDEAILSTNQGVAAPSEGTFTFTLADGQTLTLSNAGQVNGLSVDGGIVVFDFVNFLNSEMPPVAQLNSVGSLGVDLRNLSDVEKIVVFNALVGVVDGGEAGLIEQYFSGLEDLSIVEIVTYEGPVGRDRYVTVTEGTTQDSGLIFEDELGFEDVQNVYLTMEGDATITGALNFRLDPTRADNLFKLLLINSNGDAPNQIDDIQAVNNSLLNVTVNANAAFSIQDVFFNSQLPDQDATFTVNNDADVTVKSLDTSTATVAIDTLNIVNNGAGTLTVTGGSTALELDGTEELILTGTGNIALDTDQDEELPDSDGGVDSDTLSLIDASGLQGTLSLGRIINVDSEDFTFIAGAGMTTLTLGNADLGPTLLDARADDASWTFELNGDSTFRMENMLVVADPAGVNEISFAVTSDGGDASVVINQVLDLTDVDNLDFSGVGTITINPTGTNPVPYNLVLTAEQLNAVNGAGITIEKPEEEDKDTGLVTVDEVQGDLTAENPDLDAALDLSNADVIAMSGNAVMTAEQVSGRIVNGFGNNLTLVGVTADTDLTGIDLAGGTLTVEAAEADTSITIAAASVSDKTVEVTGDALTSVILTDLEDVTDEGTGLINANFTGLTLPGVAVGIGLDSTDDLSFGPAARIRPVDIAGADSVTVQISGNGTVDASGLPGIIFTGVGFEVGVEVAAKPESPTLELTADQAAVVAAAGVEGLGIIRTVGLGDDAGTTITGDTDVRWNEFVFTDGGDLVTISGFDASYTGVGSADNPQAGLMQFDFTALFETDEELSFQHVDAAIPGGAGPTADILSFAATDGSLDLIPVGGFAALSAEVVANAFLGTPAGGGTGFSSDGADITFAAGDEKLFMVTNGTNSAGFEWNDDNDNGVVDSAELDAIVSLVGVDSAGLAEVAAANFIG